MRVLGCHINSKEQSVCNEPSQGRVNTDSLIDGFQCVANILTNGSLERFSFYNIWVQVMGITNICARRNMIGKSLNLGKSRVDDILKHCGKYSWVRLSRPTWFNKC